MEQKTIVVTADEIWLMHQASMPISATPGVHSWHDCPPLLKAAYHGIAVRLANKLGLPQPVAPMGVPIAMLDQAVRGAVATTDELPDTPPRK